MVMVVAVTLMMSAMTMVMDGMMLVVLILTSCADDFESAIRKYINVALYSAGSIAPSHSRSNALTHLLEASWPVTSGSLSPT